jgi:hypothetical protein
MAETVEELKQEMVDRYAALSNDEKDVIGSMVGTQELRVLGKVLGPEISNIANLSALKTTAKPRKRGLGTR